MEKIFIGLNIKNILLFRFLIYKYMAKDLLQLYMVKMPSRTVPRIQSLNGSSHAIIIDYHVEF